MIRIKKNIKHTFIRNYFFLFRDNILTNILFWLDIVGWVISLFPKITIQPLCVLALNIIVLVGTGIHIFIKEEYKIITDPKAILLEHTYHINGITITSDEKLLASCGGDHYAILWDIDKRKIIFRMPHNGWVGNITFSLDSKYLFTVNKNNGKEKEGLFNTWNIQTRNLENRRLLSSVSRGLAVNPTGNRVAISSKDGTCSIIDPLDKKFVSMQMKISDVELRKICISNTGVIITANIIGEIFIMKSVNNHGNYLLELIHQDDNKEMIRNLCFNSTGTLLAFTDSGGYLKILDIKTKRIITSIKAHNGHAIAVVFTPNNQFLATGGQDNIIRIWKFNNYHLLMCFEIQGHTDDVTSLVFGHSLRLYSASRDGSIKIWDLEGLYQ